MDAYDDTLSYWAKVNEDDVAALSAAKSKENFLDIVKARIEASDWHIYRDHMGKFHRKTDRAVIFRGLPPW